MDPNSSGAPKQTPNTDTPDTGVDAGAPAAQNAPLTTPEQTPVSTPNETTVTPSAAPVVSDSATPGAVVSADASSTVEDPAAPAGVPTASPSNGKRPRWLIPSIAAAVLILLASGGFVFGFYLPNQPDAIYKQSLQNSGKAIDTMIDESLALSEEQKAVKLDGSFTFKSASASGDIEMSGSSDVDLNSKYDISANVAGQKFTANILTTKAAKSNSPDVYLKVSGVKSMLTSAGYGALATYDNQWIAIDHTILDSGLMADGGDASSTAQPTEAQLKDAAAKIQEVNRTYLFTTDKSKAVLENKKYVGTEEMNGRTVYHYQVGYNKANLEAYVTELTAALDKSSLNAWAKEAYSKSISELMTVDELKKSIQKADNSFVFDLYADKSQKLVHAIKFTDAASKTTMTISQNYKGGDEYPFALNVVTTDATNPITAEITVTANKKTGAVKMTASGDMGKGSDKVTYTGEVTATPNNDKVEVTVPKNSRPITEVIGQLFGGYSSSSSLYDEEMNDLIGTPSTTPFTLTQ